MTGLKKKKKKTEEKLSEFVNKSSRFFFPPDPT